MEGQVEGLKRLVKRGVLGGGSRKSK